MSCALYGLHQAVASKGYYYCSNAHEVVTEQSCESAVPLGRPFAIPGPESQYMQESPTNGPEGFLTRTISETLASRDSKNPIFIARRCFPCERTIFERFSKKFSRGSRDRCLVGTNEVHMPSASHIIVTRALCPSPSIIIASLRCGLPNNMARSVEFSMIEKLSLQVGVVPYQDLC